MRELSKSGKFFSVFVLQNWIKRFSWNEIHFSQFWFRVFRDSSILRPLSTVKQNGCVDSQMEMTKSMFFFQQINSFFTREQNSSNSQSNSSTNVPRVCRRLTDLEKMIDILNHIRSLHWTVKDFLNPLHKNAHHHALKRFHEQILNFVFLDFFKKKNFLNQFNSHQKNIIFKNLQSLKSNIQTLRQQTSLWKTLFENVTITDDEKIESTKKIIDKLFDLF